jgi:hypothetical protein
MQYTSIPGILAAMCSYYYYNSYYRKDRPHSPVAFEMEVYSTINTEGIIVGLRTYCTQDTEHCIQCAILYQ